jgi:hypothetical protein
MELTTGGVIITDAIKYVQGQMDHLNNQEEAIAGFQTREGRRRLTTRW